MDSILLDQSQVNPRKVSLDVAADSGGRFVPRAIHGSLGSYSSLTQHLPDHHAAVGGFRSCVSQPLQPPQRQLLYASLPSSFCVDLMGGVPPPHHHHLPPLPHLQQPPLLPLPLTKSATLPPSPKVTRTNTGTGMARSRDHRTKPKPWASSKKETQPRRRRERSREEEATMADYHFVYKDVEGASTQWDDIQRRLGNLPPKPEPFKPAPFSPADDPDLAPKSKAWIDDRTPAELDELEDDPELDDDRFLQEYRKRRLAEMREVAKVARFGSVMPISGSDFVREVSQAPADVWVVVLLYKDSIQDCGLLLCCLEELATKYPATKFVKIISTECIPNYPDRNLPTILVYNNGAVKGTYVGLHQFGSRRCTPEAVALALCQSDPVLNDGQTGSSSTEGIIRGVQKRFIEKFVADHEEKEDDDYSD